MYAEVRRIENLSPSLRRVTLGGGTIDQFEASGATDAYINARFLPAASPLTVPFEAEDLDAVDPEDRPRPRRFTIRRWDEDRHELVIDFVIHGDAGYAGSWAKRARPGDRLQFSGPGGSYRPSPALDWHLLVGDESAIGAIGASLESLPAGALAKVLAVVDAPGYEIDLPSPAEVELTWLYRSGAADQETQLADAVAACTFPPGDFDVFVHGEAAEVRAVRRHLIAERGIDPATASISPYWRRRHSDEVWRSVKREWLAEQAADV